MKSSLLQLNSVQMASPTISKPFHTLQLVRQILKWLWIVIFFSICFNQYLSNLKLFFNSLESGSLVLYKLALLQYSIYCISLLRKILVMKTG